MTAASSRSASAPISLSGTSRTPPSLPIGSATTPATPWFRAASCARRSVDGRAQKPPLPSREREGPAKREGEGALSARSDERPEPPHHPVAPQRAPSALAGREGLSTLRSTGLTARRRDGRRRPGSPRR